MKDVDLTDPTQRSGLIAAAAFALLIVFSLIALASIYIGS